MNSKGGSSSFTESLILVGESPAMERLRHDIESAARVMAKVLICGETGVGKEVVARLTHVNSARAAKPFVAMNCSGIPETLLASELFGHVRGSFTGAYRDKPGLVRQADRGTLFLDELGEMSLTMQAALLRFAESGEIQPVGSDAPIGRTDVRLIAATNRDLRERIEAGAFREDLYYRLNVIQINVPPLRERGRDVLLLFRHYLARAAETHGVPTPDLLSSVEDLLLGYAWPGNVRELKNVTERLALRRGGATITPDDLPLETRGATATAVAAAPPQAADAEQPPESPARSAVVDRLWQQIVDGQDFWTVVREPFRAREITRSDLAGLIDRGLRETRGSYRALLKVFNLPLSDYKRFHAFLYQQNCNLAVQSYRYAAGSGRAGGPTARIA